MAHSDASIATLALRLLGDGRNTVADLQTDTTVQAKACRAVYETARDEVLRDHPWQFAMKRAELAQVEADPNEEWAYSYRYPSDCLFIRRIPSGIRATKETLAQKIEYEIGRDDTGLLIFTDVENAEVEYTMKEEDAGRYHPDFVMALAFRIAAYVAPQLAPGDSLQITERMVRFYMASIGKAKGNSENERRPGGQPESEIISSRT